LIRDAIKELWIRVYVLRRPEFPWGNYGVILLVAYSSNRGERRL